MADHTLLFPQQQHIFRTIIIRPTIGVFN